MNDVVSNRSLAIKYDLHCWLGHGDRLNHCIGRTIAYIEDLERERLSAWKKAIQG